MYLKRNSLFLSSLGFLILSLIFAPNLVSQTRKYQKAIVIVTIDYLRELPISSATLKTSVRKGARLNVMPAASAPGWYLGYEEGIFILGYIHGNSIRLDTQPTSGKTKAPKTTPKNVPATPPKYIVLDIPSDDSSPSKKVKKAVPLRPASKPNLCLPPLYCPDIEEVQTMLLTNRGKFEKGKFEKTADWEKRLPNVLNEFKLSEGHTAAEKMIFLYEQGTGTFDINDPEYDADKELWSFPIEVKTLDPGTCIPLMSQKTGELFCLVTPKQFASKFNAVVSMPPATASANNKNLQIAFIGRIIAPYTWSGTYSRVKDILSGIYFSIDEIICLNPKTGQRWKVDIPLLAPFSEVFISPSGVDSSEEDLKSQSRINPRDGTIYLKLGKIYFVKDELDLAIIYLKTALIWDNSLVDAHSLLGEIYLRKGQCAEAKERVNSALKLSDNNPAALSVKERVEKCVDLKNKSNI